MALNQQTGKPVRLRGRIGLAAIGHTAKQVEEFLFDWLLYGAVVAFLTQQYGALWGSIAAFCIMTPISAIICLTYMKIYDWSKKDWFGFEAAKMLRDDLSHGGYWKRLMRSILRLGDIPAFILLSLHFDPFMTTVYLRKGTDNYDGLTKRDWTVFYGSVLFSNGYWTLRWTVIVAVAAWVWAQLPPSYQDLTLEAWDWLSSFFM